MNNIAIGQSFGHQVISNSELSKVRVLAHPKIQCPSDTKHKVVAPPNDVTSNISEICRYYLGANQNISSVIVDSKNYAARTADVLRSNFYKHKLPIHDAANDKMYKVDDELAYLYAGYQATKDAELLQLASSVAVKYIPLTFETAKDLTSFYLEEEPDRDIATPSLDQYIANNRILIEENLNINHNFRQYRVPSINTLTDHPSFTASHTIAVKAKTGVGKTKHVFSPIAQNAGEENKVVYVSHLIALVHQFCNNNSATNYQSNALFGIERANSLALVINSIHKPHLLNAALNCDVLIIDEFEKVLSAVVCSDNNPQMDADLVFQAICEALRNARKVIVGDADLSNISLEFLRGIRGDLTVMECTENPYRHIAAEIQSKDVFLQQPDLKNVLLSDRVFLFDSRQTLKQTLVHLKFKNHKGLDCEDVALKQNILVVHGDNKDNPEQKAFLASPNDEIHKYAAILASPCLGSGFSIETDYTDKVHVICDKTLAPQELINFSRRFRKATTICFSVQTFQKFRKIRDFSALKIQKEKEKLKKSIIDRKEKQNFSLALSLFHTLELLGFDVKVITSGQNQQNDAFLSNQLKKKKLNDHFIQAIIDSPDISKEKKQKLTRSNEKNSLDITALKKYDVKKIYLLESVTREDVEFDWSFNREMFDYLPFVRNEYLTTSKKNYDPNLHESAKIIHSIVLRDYKFDVEKSQLFIFKSDIIKIATSLKRHQKLLNCYLGTYSQVKTVDSTDKATRMIKAILKSLGLHFGSYGGKHQKARISLSKHASNHRLYLNGHRILNKGQRCDTIKEVTS
ncbi:hypothetical protein BCU70_17810 [Vibrio sp. 10N.286.49.C2]|nr:MULTISPECIES: hypothetical protein [unclassified Vibrio]PMH36285.1 hypothetical protein BCU70_17810 [Vibrio sp. 10N.286.49.C2]PMH53401.1 hypothetical protein BCU66_00830 [Vibrio sp. 10N.286.49.B1]